MLPNRLPLVRLRLALDKAATRRRRQAQHHCQASNSSRMRAELRRRVAVVAAARCGRRDATHNNAFEHLLWLHACSGYLGVMNARRLSHLKNAGASAALEIARQEVLADRDMQDQEHISLSTLDMTQRLIDFDTFNTVDMQVCASCCTQEPVLS